MPKGYISYPSSKSLNPFISILSENLEKYGWEEKEFNIWRKPLALFKLRKQIKILYFHWPEYLWRSDNFFISFLKAISFIIFTSYARFLNIKLVFSGHNVLPHFKPGNKYLEFYMRKWIIKKFDLIIGHSFNTQSDFEEKFNIKLTNYILGLHGTYESRYKIKFSKEKMRDEFSLPHNEIIIFLKIDSNSYKGSREFINNLIEQKVNCYLLIAGKPTEELLQLLNKINRYKLLLENYQGIEGFLSEETLAKAICASDFIALPYKSITTSGAYFLALTFEKPIIAPDLPFFKLHTLSNTALLYNQNKTNLVEIFLQIETGWKVDEKQIADLKQEFSWERTSQIIANAFNQIS